MKKKYETNYTKNPSFYQLNVKNLHLDLINLCKNLTFQDWQKIRVGNYFEIFDSFTTIKNIDEKTTDTIGKLNFVKSRVLQYYTNNKMITHYTFIRY